MLQKIPMSSAFITMPNQKPPRSLEFINRLVSFFLALAAALDRLALSTVFPYRLVLIALTILK
ncbi:MAG: hypothetical protein CM15mV127_260 [Caudoviricetes sp.]|nr:MAG: hypothetical protein CM15mV127_260 [Caudoviricetes sp.]